ncbi:hypothetical protein K9M47_03990 [Candidatus Gracilibacteria bacterium]|nr:hypothetical protein [Candidatus Gracilibacteria bacterium]MCF7898717.1 hypothetical protein [Candidatus Paceibacterota bacterium]
MIDPELKKHLQNIEKEVRELKEASTGLKSTLIRGLVYGAGYVIGAVIIVVLIGWILNIVGIIPVFNSQVTEFREALDHFSKTVQ